MKVSYHERERKSSDCVHEKPTPPLDSREYYPGLRRSSIAQLARQCELNAQLCSRESIPSRLAYSNSITQLKQQIKDTNSAPAVFEAVMSKCPKNLERARKPAKETFEQKENTLKEKKYSDLLDFYKCKKGTNSRQGSLPRYNSTDLLSSKPRNTRTESRVLINSLVEKRMSRIKDIFSKNEEIVSNLRRRASLSSIHKLEDPNDVCTGPVLEKRQASTEKIKSTIVPMVPVEKNVIKRLPDGSVYQGDLIAGLFEGHGKLTDPFGRSYDGQWKSGKKCGYGKEYDSGRNLIYEGHWEDDQYSKTGMLYRTNRDESEVEQNSIIARIVKNWYKYEGDFKDGKKHGRGVLYLPHGQLYCGTFFDDQLHGKGMLQMQSRLIECEWFANSLRE